MHAKLVGREKTGYIFIDQPYSTCSTTARAFLAANPPMETWSSDPQQVVMESTVEGWVNTLFSDTKIIRLSCWILNPYSVKFTNPGQQLCTEVSWRLLERIKVNLCIILITTITIVESCFFSAEECGEQLVECYRGTWYIMLRGTCMQKLCT